MNMIETKHLTKSYAGFTAVSDVSLHIPKGAVYGPQSLLHSKRVLFGKAVLKLRQPHNFKGLRDGRF